MSKPPGLLFGGNTVDYIVVCFLKPLNSARFLLGMVDQVANRLDLRPAAELLGGWPGFNLFAYA